MLKRINWYLLFGAFFIVMGVLFLFTEDWLKAAWSITLGGGNLFVAYGRQHPDMARGRLGWTVAILWIVFMAVLTIMRLRGS